MASKKVQIEIDTKSTGDGAKQAADGLQKVGAESEKATKRRVAAEERAALKAEQAAKKAADAVIREEKRKTAAAEAEAAKRVKAEERAQTQAAQASAKAARGRSQVAGQVGLQVQDIAVQAQMGVKATTILAQQGSQLLGVFGPYGAIAGGILAIGAAAFGVFNQMSDDTQTAAEKAEFLSKAIQDIAEKAEKLKSEELDMGREAITQAIEMAKILQSGYEMVAASEQKYSEGALANAEALRLAQVELRRLKGEDVDELKEANNAEAFRLALIEQRKQQELAAQKAREDAAKQDIQNAQDELNLRGRQLEMAKQELETEIQKLEAIKAQKSELEKTSKETTIDERQSIRAGVPIYKPSDAASAAQQTLASTPFDADIAVIEKKIAALSQATESNSSGLITSLNAAAEGLLKANTAFQLVTQSVEAETANIIRAADQERITETIKSRVTEAEAHAKAVNAEIANFVPVDEMQAQALEAIKQRTGDLKITADETAVVAQNLQTIRNSLVQGQQLNVSATESIIKSLESYNLRLKELERRAQALPSGTIR